MTKQERDEVRLGDDSDQFPLVDHGHRTDLALRHETYSCRKRLPRPDRDGRCRHHIANGALAQRRLDIDDVFAATASERGEEKTTKIPIRDDALELPILTDDGKKLLDNFLQGPS